MSDTKHGKTLYRKNYKCVNYAFGMNILQQYLDILQI